MNALTKITLESAQEIAKDPQAIQRKYLSQEVIELAYEIATETKQYVINNQTRAYVLELKWI